MIKHIALTHFCIEKQHPTHFKKDKQYDSRQAESGFLLITSVGMQIFYKYPKQNYIAFKEM